MPPTALEGFSLTAGALFFSAGAEPSSLSSLPSAGSSRSHEEARRLFDDYDSLDGGSALENQKSSGPDRVTPIPKAQLATLCAVRLVDPIAFTQIFPYVNEMINHLHLTNDPSKIGFYSGIVVSIADASRANHLYPS